MGQYGAIRYLTEEPTVRESRIFLNGLEITGNPPELWIVHCGPLMPVHLTNVRRARTHQAGELDRLTRGQAV
jgi:hypothetical protein